MIVFGQSAPGRIGGSRLVDETANAGGSAPPHTRRRQPAERWQSAVAVWLCRAEAWARSPQAGLLGLALSGLLLEASLALGWLSAFSLAGHSGFPAFGQDALVWLLGDGPSGINHFLALLLTAFLPYILAVGFAARARGRLALVVAIGSSAVFGCTQMGMFPAGTTDIFHNVLDGRLLWVYHFNPILVAPSAISRDPLFGYLHYWQSTRAPYGPLWYLLTGPAVLAGGTSLLRNILAFKALPFIFELISLLLIVAITRRTDPRHTVAAAVTFGWNPLVLWETAGNGHNDILMMAFVLLTILLLLTRHWPFAFSALACSVLVKYATIVLLPVFVLWVLYRYGRSALPALAAGLAGAAMLAVIVYAPFWAGAQNFAALQARQGEIFLSPLSALIGTWGEEVPNTPAIAHVKNLLTLAFAGLYLVALLRVRRDPATMIRACVEIIFLLLILLTWWFWPWYVVWGVALAALLPASAHARLFVLFSTTAMLIYVSSAWRLTIWNFDSSFPLAVGTGLLVFTTPVIYAIVQVFSNGARLPARDPVAASQLPDQARRLENDRL
jgi:hypothetical protein